MNNKNEQIWIEEGYKLFASEGPKGLKVEHLARLVGKSKSSFYHLFADTEVFQEKLLTYHRERAHEIAIRAKLCEKMVPDFIHLGLEIKSDLLFNKQLRIHREKQDFQLCFEEANTIVEEAFMGIWADAFGLSNKPHVARSIMKITTDNFYLRITEDNLTYEWAISFLSEIQLTIKDIIRNSNASDQ